MQFTPIDSSGLGSAHASGEGLSNPLAVLLRGNTAMARERSLSRRCALVRPNSDRPTAATAELGQVREKPRSVVHGAPAGCPYQRRHWERQLASELEHLLQATNASSRVISSRKCWDDCAR